jgi:dihydroorotate dehydrogenase electron transfer subunit
MIETTASVQSNLALTPDYKLLVLEFDRTIEAQAGQFAMLKPSGALEPILRRALAIYAIEGSTFSFLYHVFGRGTIALSQLREGDRVDSLIPLGNSWNDFTASARRAIVVAGGIGSASVFLLCGELKRRMIDTTVFFGAASERAAAGCGLHDFERLGLPIVVSTDDGSLGDRGYITKPFEEGLAGADRADLVVYTCGPWVMMKRVAEIAAAAGVKCYASLEAPMGCGFGVCVGCVVAVNTDAPLGYSSYKRVCIDGSIFPADQVRWDVDAMTH